MNYYSNKRDEIIRHIPSTCANLLDIGCGSGSFGLALKEKNPNIIIYGVEPVEEAANIAKQHLDHVYCSLFDKNINLPENYFDIITFNDSLEHFIEPYSPLKLSKKLINKNGLIIASIPNFRYIVNIRHILIDKDFHYTDEGILDKTHLRFFTLKSIKRLFADVGLEIISIEGLNPHYWSGKRIMLLRLFFNRLTEDMRYLQYLVIARPL